MDSLRFHLPANRVPSRERSLVGGKATARVFTHKGEYLQGPAVVEVDGVERYTMGVFSLLDDLHSAFVDVRATRDETGEGMKSGVPTIEVAPNGWNEGECELVQRAVIATWDHMDLAKDLSYRVYGYHDILVGAGSGSSSALVQAAILATAREHGVELDEESVSTIHSLVESGADPLGQTKPAIVATRYALGRPIRQLGWRTPQFKALTWSAGKPVRTRDVEFAYDHETLLTWRVRWASVERAVRQGDDARLARLAMASALENQVRNPNRDIDLLADAVENHGALGYCVAHTGTYHTALFPASAPSEQLVAFSQRVTRKSESHPMPQIFETASAAERRR
jgi:uncharacterized protein involved in propanediol utilization